MNHRDNYECSNCWTVGQLDRHGRCRHCSSSAVMSVHLIEMLLGHAVQEEPVTA